MSPSPTKSVFISYRRRDSSTPARWLSETIERTFGNTSVFIDTGVIQTGDEWPVRIEQALAAADVLIVVIGPEWLRIHDEFGRRRLDDPDDWVRKEILYAIEKKLMIVPLLISNAELPEQEGLPTSLVPLLRHQAYRLRDEHWQDDVIRLLDRLAQVGLERTGPVVEYPPPGKRPRELSEQEMTEVLNGLPEWKLAARIGSRGEKRTELTRTFIFASFEDAMHFMFVATRHISKVDHHPDWENIWRTITVWLTTWDIGNKPSAFDVELAQYLDELFQKYDPR